MLLTFKNIGNTHSFKSFILAHLVFKFLYICFEMLSRALYGYLTQSLPFYLGSCPDGAAIYAYILAEQWRCGELDLARDLSIREPEVI